MSVFTFDHDPPKVASPWLKPVEPGSTAGTTGLRPKTEPGLLSDYGVTKLEAEPQDGPTEYKLHLLLRPRRKYERISTTTRISGSTQSRPPSESRLSKNSPAPGGSSSPSSQTRQDRLEHLTTQLLWRLQQSCPYHAGSAAPSLVVPRVSDEAISPGAEVQVGKLLPGLEASRGALYEIGVADDGTLAGLAKDEMDESLNTLRVMAASLGCNMEILRMVIVGDCEWTEPTSTDELPEAASDGVRRRGELWVAEALVTPDQRPREGEGPAPMNSNGWAGSAEASLDPKQGPLTANQLRVTLTGPTTSGKSTLLGTLSTGTLDNGRGKSRLSLLKHRHEVASGVTSSVAHELIGYNGGEIINYSHSGIESWIDIHDFTRTGRLVYLLDSAGHPRYHRTILRGLVGWAPHWTVLCLAADSPESASAIGVTWSSPDGLGPTGAGVDLSSAYLDLCLRLNLPLAIVITKLDLADNRSMRLILSKVMSSIKRAGRKPAPLRGEEAVQDSTGRVSPREQQAVTGVVESLMAGGLLSVVPIVLTSAVNGQGIGMLHAVLESLPLPPEPTSLDYIGAALNPEQPSCLFHIEDKYSLPASCALATTDHDQQTDLGTVVAGHLRFGRLSIGDKVVVGPFPPDDAESRVATPDERPSPGGDGLSTSHPSTSDLGRIAALNAASASATSVEWYGATIVSIRNLRLPVQTLEAGQVGSIGMVFDHKKEKGPAAESGAPQLHSMPRIRKGMVLAVPSRHMVATGLSLQAASGLTAFFEEPGVAALAAGSLVNLYVASVRAAARVKRVSATLSRGDGSRMATEDIDDVFSLSEDTGVEEEPSEAAGASGWEVQLELLSNREWVELGSNVLLVEGGGKDRSGLEGYVGKVVEIVD